MTRNAAVPAAPAGDGESRRGRAEFVHAWRARLTGTSYVTMTAAEVGRLLEGFAGQLVDALVAEPFTPAPAYEVGQALVEARFSNTNGLSETVAIIGERLPYLVAGRDEVSVRSRVHALQGMVAAGFGDALRDRVLDEQQAIGRAAIMARDQAARLLRASEMRFRTLFAEVATGIVIADVTGRILDVNQALLDMLGYDLDELCRHQIADLVRPDDVPEEWGDYDELIRGERDHLRVDKPLYRRDGTPLWAHLSVSLIRDDDGRRRSMVAMLEDITDRHLWETRLRYQATHDSLTQLPNRALFLESLERVCANSSDCARLGLCFLDLDGFKVVNDSYGHQVGDRLLVEIAARLDKCVSTAGHLVARLGGDEFVILVSDTNGPAQVIDVAEQVLAALSTPIPVGSRELSVSASIGIVERPVAGADPAEVVRAADITLYRAKSDGKGRWALFSPMHNAYEVARSSLSAAMPLALAHDEFFLDYQPVVRLADGALLGVEALPRWRHPRSGVLGPEQFIPLADETGLSVTLGRWMLRRACEQIRAWEKRFPTQSMFVSVTLGARQSRDPRLVEDVAAILRETGVDPGRLQLELTDSPLAYVDSDEPMRLLQVLSGMGVRLTLGDLGPGYANVARLRGLPVDTLKIAGAFVEGVGASQPEQDSDYLAGAIITLAHTLRLSVTANGVQNAIQAERLRAIGCDNAQGWFIAPPAPPERIVELLAATDSGHRQGFMVP